MVKESKFWNKKTMITALIVILMVSSTAGFIFGRNQGATTKYNGYKFTYQNNGWTTKIDGQQIQFHHHPSDLENITLSDDIVNVLNVPRGYLTFEAGENLQYIDMTRFEFITAMKKYFNTEIISGTLYKTDAYDFPIIDCVNVTEQIPVIKFISANETKITINENCVIAEGEFESEFLKIADKILYKLFGVV